MSLICDDSSGSGIEFPIARSRTIGKNKGFTILAGFNSPDNVGGSNFSAILSFHDTTADPFITVQMNTAGRVRCFYRPGGNPNPSATCDSGNGFDDDQWHGVMFVEYANNDHRGYFDWTNEDTDITSISNTVTLDSLRISNPPGGNALQGRKFARVMYFSRSMSVDEGERVFKYLDFRNGLPEFWCDVDEKSVAVATDRISGLRGLITDMSVVQNPSPPFMWPIEREVKPVYFLPPTSKPLQLGLQNPIF